MDDVFNSFAAAPEQQYNAKALVPESFGSHLRSNREEKNISLEELCWATKIRMEYLIAIEEGRFDLLPGEIFAKGYIRSYSKYLAMDPDETVAMFTKCKKGDCSAVEQTQVVEKPTMLTRIFMLVEVLKRLITGREDQQIY